MPKIGRFYLIDFPDPLRFRNMIIKRGGKIEPMIQIEARIDDDWLPVIRCDRSHDFLHLDLYHRNGKKIKVELKAEKPIDSIRETFNLIQEDWKKIFRDLDYPELLENFETNKEFLIMELKRAEQYLIEEIKSLEDLFDLRGKGVKPFTIDAVLVDKRQKHRINKENKNKDNFT